MNRHLQILFMIILSLLSVLMVVLTFNQNSNYLTISKQLYSDAESESAIASGRKINDTIEKSAYSFFNDDERIKSPEDDKDSTKATGVISVPDGIVYLLFLVIAYLAVKMSSAGVAKKQHS